MTTAIISPAWWTPSEWHGVRDCKQWRVGPGGIELENVAGFRRTAWPPREHTAETIYRNHRKKLDLVRFAYPDIATATLVATASQESNGNRKAERYEARHDDYSIGICQQMTKSAFTIGRRMGWPRATSELTRFPRLVAAGLLMPLGPYPGVPLLHWRRFLGNAFVSFSLAAAIHDENDRKWDCRGCPVLQYACYNAGHPRVPLEGHENDWGLHHTLPGLDGFTNFYNDAVNAIQVTRGAA